MKRAAPAALAAVLVLSGFSVSEAKEQKTQRTIFYRPNYEETSIDIPGFEAMMSLAPAAAVDTYCMVWYDFDLMDWQGWTSVDKTAQVDTFFHVDDFAGLGGGDFGRLTALEGVKSLWCGTRPGSDFYLCSWLNAPGYGNDWDQVCQSAPIHFTGLLNLSYKCVTDSEQDYDVTYVEYDAGGGNWTEIASYDGVDTIVDSYQLLLSQAYTKLRFHFASDGVWSDQDGVLNTDGAFVVDSITVSDDYGIIDFEDFEAYSTGDRTALGIWDCFPTGAYGSYAAIRNNLIDEDPCALNMSTVIAFFGTVEPPLGGGNIDVTPFCQGGYFNQSPCQDEMAVSPIIDMGRYSTACDEVQDGVIPAGELSSLGGVLLRYAVYVDLPLSSLVFRTWQVRSLEDGCPGLWQEQWPFISVETSRIWRQEEVDSHRKAHLPRPASSGRARCCGYVR